MLTNLRFMRPDGRLTLSGLLLFGKTPQLFRPTLTAKCISFYGTSIGGNRFRDRIKDADMEGNLRHQYDTIMAFFRRNLRYVQPGEEFNTQRVLEVSDIALSELVMNALIHRSLVRPAPIRIFILDDRIEIHSPGNLPRGLIINDIENGTSMPRNEQLFYHANFLLPYSGAGTGILRAIDKGLEMYFKNDEQTREFVITIPRKIYEEPSEGNSNEVTNEDTNEDPKEATNEATNKANDHLNNEVANRNNVSVLTKKRFK
ncbi:MAG: hypothetical protein K2H71_04195 [Muribaculaceae bacterium]|nr:hypothetical protein [Muribaculaceae bacterium]